MSIDKKRGAQYASHNNLSDNTINHKLKPLTLQEKKYYARKEMIEDFNSLSEKYEELLPSWEFSAILTHLSTEKLMGCLSEETVINTLHQAIREGVKNYKRGH